MRLRLPYEHLEGRFLAGSTRLALLSAVRAQVVGNGRCSPGNRRLVNNYLADGWVGRAIRMETYEAPLQCDQEDGGVERDCWGRRIRYDNVINWKCV